MSAALSFGGVARADSSAPVLFLVYFCPSLFPDGCRWHHRGGIFIAHAAVCLVSLSSLPGVLPWDVSLAEHQHKQQSGVRGLFIAIAPPEIQHPG